MKLGFSGAREGLSEWCGAFCWRFPALVLALVFGALLASGNAVFGTWTGDFSTGCGGNCALPRLRQGDDVAFRWLRYAALLRPGLVSGRMVELDSAGAAFAGAGAGTGASFSSALILVVLNLISPSRTWRMRCFCGAETVLPGGVDYRAMCTSGVDTLIFTVLLSAIVLAWNLPAGDDVSRSRALKALACCGSRRTFSCLRVGAADEALHRRIRHVGAAAGRASFSCSWSRRVLGLLAIKIVREKSLPWLVGGCASAIFATFYITQFLELAGWSADYNVARMGAESRGIG